MGLLSIPIFFLLVLILFAILFPRFMRALFIGLFVLFVAGMILGDLDERTNGKASRVVFGPTAPQQVARPRIDPAHCRARVAATGECLDQRQNELHPDPACNGPNGAGCNDSNGADRAR